MEKLMSHENYDPPEELSDSSKSLWRAVCPSRCKSRERVELLRQALLIRDRVERLREQLDQEGLVVDGPKMPHANPLIQQLESAERRFIQTWKILRLDWNPQRD